MKHIACFVVLGLFLSPAFAADEPKLEDLLGKWELTEEVAKIPKGTTFDFQKDGKLVLGVDVKGETKLIEVKYELKAKEKVLAFTIGDKTDTTEIVTLTKSELVCKEKGGATAKFKRAK